MWYRLHPKSRNAITPAILAVCSVEWAERLMERTERCPANIRASPAASIIPTSPIVAVKIRAPRSPRPSAQTHAKDL